MPLTAADLLALDPLGGGVFRGCHNLDNGRGGAVFGGQPLGQALAAARATLAADWPAHTLSAHFLRAADPARPIDYRVEATRDGRRFASRRVEARQGGRPVFDMLCAFHDAEDGPAHVRAGVPAMPEPETLGSIADYVAAHADRLPPAMVALHGGGFPVELRLADPETVFEGGARPPALDYWFRMPSAAGIADAHAHQALLAFMSDYWFAGTAGAPHFRPSGLDGVSVVTLNHSLWFHGPLRVDDWLLYATESPWAGQGRGLVRGLIHDRAGRLVASTAQEISIRGI